MDTWIDTELGAPSVKLGQFKRLRLVTSVTSSSGLGKVGEGGVVSVDPFKSSLLSHLAGWEGGWVRQVLVLKDQVPASRLQKPQTSPELLGCVLGQQQRWFQSPTWLSALMSARGERIITGRLPPTQRLFAYATNPLSLHLHLPRSLAARQTAAPPTRALPRRSAPFRIFPLASTGFPLNFISFFFFWTVILGISRAAVGCAGTAGEDGGRARSRCLMNVGMESGFNMSTWGGTGT